MDRDAPDILTEEKAIVWRSIDALQPYESNPRTHSPEQITLIAASIAEYGWTNPILIDDGDNIVAGHGRLMAAREMGMAEVPCLALDGLTEVQKRAYVIADNKLAEAAGWDKDLLKIELGQLKEADFDLSLTGFGDLELERLDPILIGGASPDDRAEETPEPPAVPVAQRGDLWALGEHRLLCGDATDEGDVRRLLGEEDAALCFTSPPYAQQRDYGAAKEMVADWDALMQGVFSALPAGPSTQILVNLGLVHRDNEWLPYWDSWIAWMREQGWRRFGLYVWDQGPGMPGDWNGRLGPSFEFIFHFNTESRQANKVVEKQSQEIPDKTPTMRGKDGQLKEFGYLEHCSQSHKVPDNVIRINRQKGRPEGVEHPAIFPVKLPHQIISTYSQPGDLVYDPFLGSGTTLIAAEMARRRGCGMELDPAYCDVIVQRWETYTGQNAVLVKDQ